MATWSDMATESLLASKQLLDSDRWRSSASRAYYAVYAALVDRGCVVEGGPRTNPSHEQLPKLVLNRLDAQRYTLPRRRIISKRVRTLRMAREVADYQPGDAMNRDLARDCVRQAAAVFRELEE